MYGIDYLFRPRSIAVIGASGDTKKIGHIIVKNALAGGYGGKIFPVNPGGGEILGLKAYKSIEEIEGAVDIACTVIPAAKVYESVKACARKGVKYNLVISSGFSEIGCIAEEKKIVDCARAYGMRIIGPNIFGMYSAAASLDATFGPGNILPGSIAIITQSGALGLAMVGKTKAENIGLSAIVSVGNKSDVDESELLEYFAREDRTRVILMYIEGIKNGRNFIDSLKKATEKKPVVVIKSGRSARGAVAAASHTGSLAGADEIVDAVIKQSGALRADSIRDAFGWCRYLAYSPAPTGDRAVIITNGGGIGVMATDACEQYGIDLYDNPEQLKKWFSPVTPGFGSTKNPVDITGAAASSEYNRALDISLNRAETGVSIALYCETAVFRAEELVEVIDKNHRSYSSENKPLLFVTVGGADIENVISTLGKKNIPVFGDVYEAVACLGKSYAYQRYLGFRTDEYENVDIDTQKIECITRSAMEHGRYFLLAHEAHRIMEIIGIAVPKSLVAHNLDEAVSCAEKIGYPAVMKIVSKDIIHKSDVGGVILDLEDRDEIIDAYQAIIQRCRQYKPDAHIEGVEIREMLIRDVETIIGARRDSIFGPVVMFGLGGIYVEVMKDVSFRYFPLNRLEIMSMIKETRSYPLLLGARGEQKKDIETVVTTLLKLGALIQKTETISDIEINPLMVYEQGRGARAVDVRILLSKH